MNFYKILVSFIFLGLFSFTFAQQTTKETEQNREVKYLLIEAQTALSKGDLQTAISIYNKCTDLQKDCGVAHYELANIAIAIKNTEVALEHSRKAIKISPKNFWYQFQLAGILEERGMLAQAAETYLVLAQLQNQNLSYLKRSLSLFETVENWKKALTTCELIEKQVGIEFSLLSKKQQLYTKLQKQQKGIEELEKLRVENPQNSEIHCLLAIAYKSIGKEEKADKIYKKTSKLEQITPLSQMILYGYYMRKKAYKKAFEGLKKATESGQILEEVIIKTIIDFQQEKQIPNLKAYMAEFGSILMEKYPKNSVGYLLKAQEFRENKDFQKAKPLLETALSITPTNYNGLAQLCIVQNVERDWEGLYKTAKEGVKYYPQDHLFYFFKGLSASQKKEYIIAESSLTTAYLYAKVEPVKKEIQELLADVYYKSGKVEQSFEIYEQLLAKSPEDIMLLNNYAYFLSLERKSLEKAEKMSKKTIEKEPKNPKSEKERLQQKLNENN